MMNKLFVSFMLAFLLAAILSGIMEGGGGIKATSLTVNETAVDATLNVTSTEGFLTADVLYIGSKKISYTGTTAVTFTGCTRGFDGTDAAAHPSGSKVYTDESNAINAALGFNIASTGTTVGAIDMVVMTTNLFTVTLPKLITWDFSWLRTPGMEIPRYVLLAISTGLVLTFALMVASAFGGLMRAIFVR